jgi:hypothetical protein
MEGDCSTGESPPWAVVPVEEEKEEEEEEEEEVDRLVPGQVLLQVNQYSFLSIIPLLFQT